MNMKTNEDFFKELVDCAVKEDMAILYSTFISLISYDNNRTNEDIQNNCELLKSLINVLDNYPDNEKLQDIKDKAIHYNKKYIENRNENGGK